MVEPLCKYFNVCGGCTSQHIDYETQVENKRKLILNSLKCEDVSAFTSKPYNYRNRMEFIFHEEGLGLRKKGDWKSIVDIEECPIAEERINMLLSELRSFFNSNDNFDLKKASGTFKYVVIRAAKKTAISFVLNSDSLGTNEAVEKIKEYSKDTKADNIIITYVPQQKEDCYSEDFYVVKGDAYLEQDYLGKSFSYSVQGFFQNNTQVAEKMYGYCNYLIKKHDVKYHTLLDLYSGVGVFGILNSELFKKVIMVESVKPSIDSAKNNISKNNVLNGEAILMDAKQIKKIKADEPIFIITDPPRAGMDQKTIEFLKSKKPKHILYISCNPIQLKKDIGKFTKYKVKNVAIFDMFPQTNHIETVVELIL